MLKTALFYHLEALATGSLGPWLRRVGQRIVFASEAHLKKNNGDGYTDELVPSLRSVPLSPHQAPDAFQAEWVAPNATLVGDVKVGEGSSLWHGVVLRGDTGKIEVGRNSAIQDLTHLKCGTNGIRNLEIGDSVNIGPNVTLDSCKIESFAHIGMGATVCAGSKVEGFGVVAAGAVIPEGSLVGAGQIWAGNPGKYLRDLTIQEKAALREYHAQISELAQVYYEETEKTFKEHIRNEVELHERANRTVLQVSQDNLAEYGVTNSYDDLDDLEIRLYDDIQQRDVDMGFDMREHERDQISRGSTPYEQDLSKYPELFHRYQENYDSFEAANRKFDSELKGTQETIEPLGEDIPVMNARYKKKYDVDAPRFTGTTYL